MIDRLDFACFVLFLGYFFINGVVVFGVKRVKYRSFGRQWCCCLWSKTSEI